MPGLRHHRWDVVIGSGLPAAGYGVHILYITQTFPPEPGPTIRPLRQSVQLQALGHRVTVLTTMPSAPLGRVLEGYRWKLAVREVIEGVPVLRICSLPVANRGFLRRALSCLSFCFVATLCGLALKRRDLVIASIPNVATEMAGYIVARTKGSRLLLEMRDLIPENLALVGVSQTSPLWRLLKRYFRRMYDLADFVCVPGASMAAHLEHEGIPAEKVLLLPHAADDFRKPDRGTAASLPVALTDRFIAMYCGSFSVYYDLPTLIEAARLLEHDDERVSICLVGTGRELPVLREILRDRPCRALVILDPVAPDQVTDYLRFADIAISPCVFDRPCPFLERYLTTKTVQYLHAGKPIVAVENWPVLRDILAELGGGLTVPGRDPLRLAEAIRHFAHHSEDVAACGRRAAAYADQFLMRSGIVADFERELLQRIADLDRRSPSHGR